MSALPPGYTTSAAIAARGRIVNIFGLLFGVNVAAWGWAWLAFRDHPLLLGTALVAYGLGLRHAVDADHIAAIDNVTRRLVQRGQRPLTPGLYFSLGHSSVVFALTVVIVVMSQRLPPGFESLRQAGGILGTAVSAFFLFALAFANLLVLAGILQTLRTLRLGLDPAPDQLEQALAGRGPLARVCRRLYGLIRHSWQMFPLGVLFGLGFDTASEIGVLAISAIEGARGLPLVNVLVFPALFLAGMALVDTVDGILMTWIYGWALQQPLRKLHYNLGVTLLSVAVALLVGSIEALDVLTRGMNPQGMIRAALDGPGSSFGMLGVAVIVVFVMSWLMSVLYSRSRRREPILSVPV